MEIRNKAAKQCRADSGAALAVEMWPIARPRPYAKNARKWTSRAVETGQILSRSLVGDNRLFATSTMRSSLGTCAWPPPNIWGCWKFPSTSPPT